jgi:hypothetical protein
MQIPVCHSVDVKKKYSDLSRNEEAAVHGQFSACHEGSLVR